MEPATDAPLTQSLARGSVQLTINLERVIAACDRA